MSQAFRNGLLFLCRRMMNVFKEMMSPGRIKGKANVTVSRLKRGEE